MKGVNKRSVGRAEPHQGSRRTVHCALGVGLGGQIDAADDAGRDPDRRLFQTAQDLKMEVTAENQLHIGSADHRTQLVGILQPERPLHLDLQCDGRVVEGQERAMRRGGGQDLPQPVQLGPADPPVILARHEGVKSDHRQPSTVLAAARSPFARPTPRPGVRGHSRAPRSTPPAHRGSRSLEVLSRLKPGDSLLPCGGELDA